MVSSHSYPERQRRSCRSNPESKQERESDSQRSVPVPTHRMRLDSQAHSEPPEVPTRPPSLTLPEGRTVTRPDRPDSPSHLWSRVGSQYLPESDDLTLPPTEIDKLVPKSSGPDRRKFVIASDNPQILSQSPSASITRPSRPLLVKLGPLPSSVTPLSTALNRTTASSGPTPSDHLIAYRRRLLHTLDITLTQAPTNPRDQNRTQRKFDLSRQALRTRTRSSGRLIRQPGHVYATFEYREPSTDPEMRARFAWFWGDETSRQWQRASLAFRIDRRLASRDPDDVEALFKEKLRERLKAAFRKEGKRKEEERKQTLSEDGATISEIKSTSGNTDTENGKQRQTHCDADAGTMMEIDADADPDLDIADTDSDLSASASSNGGSKHSGHSRIDSIRRSHAPISIQPTRPSTTIGHTRHRRHQPQSYLDIIDEFSQIWDCYQNDDQNSHSRMNSQPSLLEIRVPFAPVPEVKSQSQQSAVLPSPGRIVPPTAATSMPSTSDALQQRRVSTCEYWRHRSVRQSRSDKSRVHRASRAIDWEYFDNSRADEYHQLLSTMAEGSRRDAAR